MSGGVTLNKTLVTAIGTFDFYLGIFGLNPRPTNLSNYDDPQPSYLTLLFEQKMIPSLSWTYSAGAKYRPTSPLGTLILGGYDASITSPTQNMTFNFNSDQGRDLTVAVQGISSSFVENGQPKQVNLLDTPYLAYFDSTTAQIWLPKGACDLFERAFGLKHDNITDLYLVDNALHEQLLVKNPNVTFTVAQGTSGGDTMDIVLPYAAFDLSVQYPIINDEPSRFYFPIRRAANESQMVFGRTFLQESVLTADYGREKFSLAQRTWTLAKPQQLVPILPPNSAAVTDKDANDKSGQVLTLPQLIGIAVGVVGVTLISVGFTAWYLHRKKKEKWIKTTRAAQAKIINRQQEKEREAMQHSRFGSISTASGTTARSFDKPEPGFGGTGTGTVASTVREISSPDQYQQATPVAQYGYSESSHTRNESGQTFDGYSQDRGYGDTMTTGTWRGDSSINGSPQNATMDDYMALDMIKELDSSITDHHAPESIPMAELEAPDGIHEMDSIGGPSPAPLTAAVSRTGTQKSRGVFGFGWGGFRTTMRATPELAADDQDGSKNAPAADRRSLSSWARGDERPGQSKWGFRKPVASTTNAPPMPQLLSRPAMSDLDMGASPSSAYSTYYSGNFTNRFDYQSPSSEAEDTLGSLPGGMTRNHSMRSNALGFGNMGLNRMHSARQSEAAGGLTRASSKADSVSPLSPLKAAVYQPPGRVATPPRPNPFASRANSVAPSRAGTLLRNQAGSRPPPSIAGTLLRNPSFLSDAAPAEEGTVRFGGFF